MLRRTLIALVGAALLAGCSGEKSYPMAAEKVREILAHTEPPMVVFGGLAAASRSSRTSAGSIQWTVLDSGGRQLLRLFAKVEEAGAVESRVSVTVEPPTGNQQNKIAKRMADNPKVVELYAKAMAEQIDAKLEGRPFNMSAIRVEMMSAAVAVMPQIQGQIGTMVKESAEMDREDAERAADWHRDDTSSSAAENAAAAAADAAAAAAAAAAADRARD